MRKLFVTDLDGTLLGENKTITKDNYRQIEKLKASKHCFAIATGRGYDLVEGIIKQYPMDVDYFILHNGALIADKHGKIIKHEFISFKIVKAIIEGFYNEDWKIHLGTGFKSFRFGDEGKIANPYGVEIATVEEIENEKISMLGFSYKKNDIIYVDNVCREINSKFGYDVVAYRNVNYIDIVPKGCSKGDGVEYVKQREEIKQINTFAIGDSWNDVTMFDSVEHSFTFNKVEKELKTKARYIVDSVAECIEKYVLENAS
ncbi:Cof-type HAD-IIB family hydrolase [Clostridium swellfunianum]|uniref:HAD family hydrolase n=1 Tax=Clostridium swellfunianum TaxID=1367462 RepID=UPI00202DE947|nr:HAD family hydrolase [Clostridium swellfunianum]MCM0647189.1 Cof-type HAD-IIB family hydrolase [Clostridium swellfunianum]